MDSKANMPNMAGVRYMYPQLPSQNTENNSETNPIPLIGPQYPIPQPTKTPVSELMELSMRMGIEAKFETNELPGPSHLKEFVMTCTVGSITGQGKEHNKKKAKQAAAADTLKKLKESDLYKNHLFNRSSKAALSSHNNTVGRLQEATAKKGLQAPEYEFEPPVGPPHQRQFSTKVHVGTLTANGTGRSKKEAKRSAAAAMLDNMDCSNLSLHVPAKKIAFNPASSPIDPKPILFCKAGTLGT
ncbi:interferon-inducible double-stranded RNA-dependent protein kinase activator A homolog A [Exaiptasia diaphana]|uniref:DRBM domain-containing protein n=1 Tax=Exaiptasia diaphana TaxID=2652724 RepID=A0A913WWT0_EXADI|nr:interferon-inducible double-stranded RNA-dependent protein kinase activator A homolog A [Exaiptasia diaphana]KXJ17196.1 Interferon-inducible double-stranded RNA-dependent protein kinase activator A-like A [Exaiptasia diaphana]